MTTCSYGILGGDYERAGSASRCLKEMLKSIGADAQAVRRVMIAAYEAEMNVVIHAHGGSMIATLRDTEVEVLVRDHGPGIADIELAMKEGYSTAPPKARELGFGAGLGLPNIRKHSDTFSITSAVGRGTEVRFAVRYAQQQGARPAVNSMKIAGELCRQCLKCIHACPTRALRVHRGAPAILTHLCIECTCCIQTCPSRALSMEEDPAHAAVGAGRVLLVPPAFLYQFAPTHRASHVIRALRDLGYSAVYGLDDWERAHRKALRELAAGRGGAGPLVGTFCPAVTNLIEARFPSLLPGLAQLLSPLEAAWQSYRGGVALVVCPAQRTRLISLGVPPAELLGPASLRAAVLPLLARSHESDAESAPVRDRFPSSPAHSASEVTVHGVRGVVQTLEDIENGLTDGLSLLELYACDHGCFGSGLLRGANAALAQHSWMHAHVLEDPLARAVPRPSPYEPRAGIRLDPDMTKAIVKLAVIDELSRNLPGRDCGQCGAPTCQTFAEDVVLERVPKKACPHATWNKAANK